LDDRAPPRLVDGGAPVGYQVKADALPEGALTMRYADWPLFLLDAAEKGEHFKTIVGVASL
jgi:hypothetical protein